MNMIHGTIFQRKAKGRKLTFMMGGPTLEKAAEYIRWDAAKGFVFEFHAEDGSRCSILPRTVQS